jgi:hypothetical protein
VVSAAVKRLRQGRSRPRSPHELDRCREAIIQLGLLREHPGLPPRAGEDIYRVLLELVVGPRISYGSFCYIEDCAGGPPVGLLGQEVLKLQFISFVPWLLTTRSATQLSDRELMADLLKQDLRPAGLLTELSGHLGGLRPRHRVAAFDFALHYLCLHDEDARAELARRGYLADQVEIVFPGDQRAQRARLRETLAFVYGRQLTEEESVELLSRAGVRRTPALEAAVAEQTDRRVSRPATATLRVLTRVTRLINELGQSQSRPGRDR